MYETPELETDVLVRSSAIRIHSPEDFEGMRKPAAWSPRPWT